MNPVLFQQMIQKKKLMVYSLSKDLSFFVQIQYVLDACHDHFRIDKEQSMLIDCQRLNERNEPLDKPDKYGITLVKNICFFFVFKTRKLVLCFCFYSYISLLLKHILV